MTVNSKYVDDEVDNDADATVLTAALFPPEAPLLVEATVVLKASEDVPAKFPAERTPPERWVTVVDGAPVPSVKLQTIWARTPDMKVRNRADDRIVRGVVFMGNAISSSVRDWDGGGRVGRWGGRAGAGSGERRAVGRDGAAFGFLGESAGTPGASGPYTSFSRFLRAVILR